MRVHKYRMKSLSCFHVTRVWFFRSNRRAVPASPPKALPWQRGCRSQRLIPFEMGLCPQCLSCFPGMKPKAGLSINYHLSCSNTSFCKPQERKREKEKYFKINSLWQTLVVIIFDIKPLFNLQIHIKWFLSSESVHLLTKTFTLYKSTA